MPTSWCSLICIHQKDTRQFRHLPQSRSSRRKEISINHYVSFPHIVCCMYVYVHMYVWGCVCVCARARSFLRVMCVFLCICKVCGLQSDLFEARVLCGVPMCVRCVCFWEDYASVNVICMKEDTVQVLIGGQPYRFHVVTEGVQVRRQRQHN